jgi:hypothetical protein
MKQITEAWWQVIVQVVLDDRGIELYEKSTKNGRYWRNTIPCIIDMKTAAAIGAYTEGLSLSRWRVIIKDPNTGMKGVRDCHDKGLEELGLKIKS